MDGVYGLVVLLLAKTAEPCGHGYVSHAREFRVEVFDVSARRRIHCLQLTHSIEEHSERALLSLVYSNSEGSHEHPRGAEEAGAGEGMQEADVNRARQSHSAGDYLCSCQAQRLALEQRRGGESMRGGLLFSGLVQQDCRRWRTYVEEGEDGRMCETGYSKVW